jgi:hypothetical protein
MARNGWYSVVKHSHELAVDVNWNRKWVQSRHRNVSWDCLYYSNRRRVSMWIARRSVNVDRKEKSVNVDRKLRVFVIKADYKPLCLLLIVSIGKKFCKLISFLSIFYVRHFPFQTSTGFGDFFLDGLTLQNGTDKSSRNFGN